mgnify:CR=1 FL=1
MADKITQLQKELGTIIKGKKEVTDKIIMAVLARGHVLLEDVPGVGKTTTALALCRLMGMDFNRIQFTPDVVPSDVTGFTMYEKQTGRFIYRPGAVMCNMLLADEINRTSSKTQAALLEVMEEGNVTVDGVTRKVPEPFVVIATENPAGSVGTQLLPESQLDRFMICTSLGYPSLENEIAIVKGRQIQDDKAVLQPVINAEQLLYCKKLVEQIYMADDIYRYLCELCQTTRTNPLIELGVSPRGSVALMRISKAIAFLHGRDYVIPGDIDEIFLDVAAHRLVRSAKAKAAKRSAESILIEVMQNVKKPTAARR